MRRLHSVRLRLTAWYAATLALVLSIFGALLYGVVGYQLVRHHDGSLRDAAAQVARILSEHEDCESLTEAQRAQLDRVGHLVLFHEVAGEKRVFYQSADLGLMQIPLEMLASSSEAPGAGWFETVEDPSKPLRIYSEPYRSRSGRRGLIHVAAGLGDVPGPLASLRLALLLMAPLAVLFASLGGYWLAGRALAPVDEVTRMAQEIGASSLGRRLPVTKAQDEIARLVDTFNQMIARLEGSFESMKRFTADASHELRGPLTTMRGAIDVALSQPREAGEYRKALASVGEDVNRLRSIAEDLLVLARADAGRMKIERLPVRLDVVAAEVAESLRPLAVERAVSLVTRSEATVRVQGDERWLRQLVFNLLDNAIKFSTPVSSAERRAVVTIEVTGSGGAGILRVEDTGPGIPEEALPHIFERFYRADNARSYRGREGFGLGLSIAEWVVHAHHGTIAAANAAGGGTTFAVSLPLAAPNEGGPTRQES